jgi:hypothetical protein
MRSPAVWMIALPGLGLGIAFFAAFGFHSYYPTDQGYVLGLGWRIWGGQVPYRDFLSARPPLTAYLHSLWFALPEGWAFPCSRAGYYLQMTLSAVLPALAAHRAGLVRSPATLGALTAGFLAVALHNFPAMPWHTVDGVFFSSLGLSAWLVSLAEVDASRSLRWRAAASLAFASAMLCKQNFVFPALLFGLYCGFEWLHSTRRGTPGRHALVLASALPAFALGAMLSAALMGAGLLGAYFDQISTTRGLSEAAYENYAEGWCWLALLPGLAWPWLCTRIAEPSAPARLGKALVLLSLLGVAGAAVLLEENQEIGRTLLWLLLGSLIARAVLLPRERDERARAEAGLRLLLSAGVFVIGWATSLSWGYAMPNLGLGAMGVAIVDLLPRVDRRWLTPSVALSFAAILIVQNARKNLFEPYYDVPRSRQVAGLHEVYPRFGRLWTSVDLADRFAELRTLVQRHALDPGREFTVLRAFPLIHHLVDRQSPALLDWYYPNEIRGREAEVLDQLLGLDAVLLLYKGKRVQRVGDPLDYERSCEPETFEHSRRLLLPIARAGTLLEEGRYFCVVSIDGRDGDS